MPCESCAVQFSVFRRKRACAECERYYCGGCLRRGGGTMCAACRILSTRPLPRHALVHLKVRDLQFFLQRQNVSTRGCVEKEDLVNLVVSHANSGAPRRRLPPRSSPDFTHTFSTSIKGFTNNINSFINSAFDIRPQPTPAPAPPSCYNSAHVHTPHAEGAAGVPSSSGHTARTTHERAPPSAPSAPQPPQPPQRRAATAHQVPDVTVSEPESPEERGAHRDTADCLEIEDLDDAAEWEFVRRPADPLPNDCSVLLAENSNDIAGPSSLGVRAASELDLRRSESADTATDTSSLKDEPYTHIEPSLPKRIRLEDLKTLSDLEDLNVKQLKELLILNRVDFKGCVERNELLERAKRLWKESTKSREDISNLSMEESCKICMDAPMECVLLECGHIAACTACSKRLSECPICRQYVVRVVRFFRS